MAAEGRTTFRYAFCLVSIRETPHDDAFFTITFSRSDKASVVLHLHLRMLFGVSIGGKIDRGRVAVVPLLWGRR